MGQISSVSFCFPCQEAHRRANCLVWKPERPGAQLVGRENRQGLLGKEPWAETQVKQGRAM